MLRPEILLLGTGLTVLPPPPELRLYISSLGIQLDVMDSVSPMAVPSVRPHVLIITMIRSVIKQRNACSTFNLLAEEGRTMAAALMPLKPINPRTGERR